MIHLRVTTYDTKKQSWGTKEFKSRAEKAKWLRGMINLPGECKLDKRIQIAFAQAAKFDKDELYTDFVEDTYDYEQYWKGQKEICLAGLLIDNQYYITGDHYWYLNFIKIPDKVRNDFCFPRLQDLDVWTFQNIELAELEGKYMAVLKARQTGFSLKFLSRILKRLWFERGFTGKIAAYQEIYLESAWGEILVPYRNHLNTHTGFIRHFHQSDLKYNWKEGYKINKNGRPVFEGLGSSLRAYTTQQKASSVVSGKTDELLYDEAGVSLNLGKVMQLMIPALRLGNIQTGCMWIIGAAGEVKESEALSRIFYQPKGYNCLAFPNIWSGRPDEMVGMFVPYYYSFGDCMDEFGNSLIDVAKAAYAIMLEAEKEKSFNEFALFKAQYPETPEDAFSTQEENIFPVEKIQAHVEVLQRTYKPTVITLKDDNRHPTGISHTFGSETPLITDFPMKKGTDRRGAIVVDEFPEENPPYGLYYMGVDPVRAVVTEGRASLQAVYVFKAAHKVDDEYSEDKCVAWYCGRFDDPYTTFEITKKMMKRWNARTAIENDQAACIEWMIKEKMQKNLMKRSDIPILKDWVPNSQINAVEYGWRTGSGMGDSSVRNHLLGLVVDYCNEVIATVTDDEGNSRDIYGVSRIKDIMLLKEMLSYNPKRNVDRIIAFAGVLMAARHNTNRGIMVTRKENKPVSAPPAPKGVLIQRKVLSSPFKAKPRGLTKPNIKSGQIFNR